MYVAQAPPTPSNQQIEQNQQLTPATAHACINQAQICAQNFQFEEALQWYRQALQVYNQLGPTEFAEEIKRTHQEICLVHANRMGEKELDSTIALIQQRLPDLRVSSRLPTTWQDGGAHGFGACLKKRLQDMNCEE